jgi:hypothetical protein
MIFRLFLFIVILFTLGSSRGTRVSADVNGVSLLVAEYDPAAGINGIQHLYAYHFKDGSFTAKDKIISVASKKDEKTGNYVRFDLGQNKVYRDRYVITGIGNVIDIKEKKVLSDQRNQFVKASGDSIVFYTNDIFKGKYYSVLDLRTGSLNQVTNLLFAPIAGKDIEVDYESKVFKIWLYPPNGQKITLVNDAGYGEDASAMKVKHVIVPVYWLDNSNFIYAHYNQQKNFCTLNKVNADNKTVEKIGEIDGVISVPYNSYFYKDAQNDLVYICGKGNFLVDVKRKKLTLLPFENLGNGFSASVEEKPGIGRMFRFNDLDIGKHFCDQRKSRSIKDYIAVHFDIVMNGERYPQGVTVWNAVHKKWKELDAMDVAAIVGWVEER